MHPTRKQEWNPADSLGGLLISVSVLMRKVAKRELAQVGLEHMSMSRFWVMHELLECEKTQSDLCHLLSQKAPSIKQMLESLHAAGLVRFSIPGKDLRKKKWTLTKKGADDYRLARTIMRAVGDRIDSAFSRHGVDPEEAFRTKEILKILYHEYSLKEGN